ncbi:hypothetical protein PUN28_015804 [Cardiocondyla obscurior]|uniref:Uncharacterized protein n=1 Tax=Cardiocondyla obscurior TaxID=286306 RepID=A0AAW2ER15_9HYME
MRAEQRQRNWRCRGGVARTQTGGRVGTTKPEKRERRQRKRPASRIVDRNTPFFTRLFRQNQRRRKTNVWPVLLSDGSRNAGFTRTSLCICRVEAAIPSWALCVRGISRRYGHTRTRHCA